MFAHEIIIRIYEFNADHRGMLAPALRQLKWYFEWYKGRRAGMSMNEWYRIYEMYEGSGRLVRLG
jgi:hypothetical protein